MRLLGGVFRMGLGSASCWKVDLRKGMGLWGDLDIEGVREKGFFLFLSVKCIAMHHLEVEAPVESICKYIYIYIYEAVQSGPKLIRRGSHDQRCYPLRMSLNARFPAKFKSDFLVKIESRKVPWFQPTICKSLFLFKFSWFSLLKT